MERSLLLEFVRATEAGALASARFMGRGDSHGADNAAVEAMRRSMDEVHMDGTIVIGEGERDEAPMLYIGEKVGEANRNGAPPAAPAGVPAERAKKGAGRPTAPRRARASRPPAGATARPPAAVGRGHRRRPPGGHRSGGPRAGGSHLRAGRGRAGRAAARPDIYMEKLCVGPLAAGRVRMEFPIAANLRIIADSLNRHVEDITVVILDRERHKKLIEDVRQTGARIRLIADGDLTAAISAAVSGTGDHCVMGSGGAPEGVITAGALRCLGGQILGQFVPRNAAERERCKEMGIDPERVYDTHELASGANLMFAATGVTDGALLRACATSAAGRGRTPC